MSVPLGQSKRKEGSVWDPISSPSLPALTRAQLEDLVEYTLDVGRQMMECGAEAWRTENTMARIFRAYGLEVLDAM